MDPNQLFSALKQILNDVELIQTEHSQRMVEFIGETDHTNDDKNGWIWINIRC